MGTNTGRASATPFLRWVGGKRWLCQKHAALLPDPVSVKRLVLPFCGGGAMAFHYVGTSKLLLSDTNEHLMRCFAAVRDHVEVLIERLAYIEAQGYSRETYEAIVHRLNHERTAPMVQRAAWVFVVSFWGFNGLWRVNRQGLVNVAFGKPSNAGTVPRLYDPDALRACARALAGAETAATDFVPAIRVARTGDFVYLDPPFVPASKTASFTGYSAEGFSFAGPSVEQGSLFATGTRAQSDQERLASILPWLDQAGARWALSNSDTPEARALYTRPGWNILRLERSGTVSSNPTDRGAVGEILVRNFT